MPLALFLLSLVKPMIGRILVALGITAVTVVGVDLTVNAIKESLVTHISGLPADMFSLFIISGMGQAIGIIAGAVTTKIMIMQATKAFRFMGANSQ